MRDKKNSDVDEVEDEDITVILTTGEMINSLHPPVQEESVPDKPASKDKSRQQK